VSQDLGRKLAALETMTVPQLVRKYADVFGESTNGRNKVWLVRRIAWRMQANLHGGLSDAARARAAELANDADIRTTIPKDTPTARPIEDEAPPPKVIKFVADSRVPPPGTVLTRHYKGTDVRVTVRADGFEHDGTVYPSLSAVAKVVSGAHCNGFAFFQLTTKGVA
jgi:hypothetical protein